ncbi:DNA-processing protein DprA, partial [Kaarinaea lacus]
VDTTTLGYWLALLRAPGVGARTYLSLLEQFNSPQAIFEHSSDSLRKHANLSDKTLHYIHNPDWDSVEADMRWLEQAENGVITFDDAAYPALLKEIHDPPPLLFYHGKAEILHYPQLAIVGSRNPSRHGAETAQDFAKHLSTSGLVVSSGMALGIDAAAHQGSIAASGLTVAVAGTGLDRVYPARHRDLAHRIAERGVLISEFVPGSAALAAHFPRRNRIISGLSLGTLVVEAAIQSGSLITARLAMEQGREVFAIPGSIHNPLARGCHALIRQGAKLVETASDIVEELGAMLGLLNSANSPKVAASEQSDAVPSQDQLATKNQQVIDSLPSKQHRQLYQQLSFEPTSIDTLVERCHLTAESVSAILVELELRGCVTSDSGLYCRTQ